MSKNNGSSNGAGNYGFNRDDFNKDSISLTAKFDVVAKFKDFGKFADRVYLGAEGDVGSMVLRIHPKCINITQDPHNFNFKVTINIYEEEITND